MGTKWITADVITFARMNQKTLIVQAAEPAIMYPGMLWLDTDDDFLYQRKAANDGWYTVTKEELAYTITGLWTFSRGANPPFACAAGSTQVANLIAADHAASHKDGGGDELDVSELAGAIGGAGEIPETDGAAVSWVEPDGRYDPKAHVLATTGPHTNSLPLADLAPGVQGNVIIRGAADWEALAVGVAGQALLTGGAAADPSWGAPAPAAHESTHVKGGADDIDGTLDGRAIAITTQGDIVHGSAANTITRLGAGTDGQTLKTSGAGANPSWTWNKELDNAPDATDTGNGVITRDTVGVGVIPGDVLYMKADGKYWKADADAATTMPAKVMAMETKAADNLCDLLHMGYFREDSRWDWTLGNGAANLLYVHTTAGDMVQLAGKPSGSGDQLQVVGYVVTADIVFFNPCMVLAEVT